ncbi:MAG: phosphoglucosamine mutase, partial [Miltoncostaeaceae bacterium]
VNINVGCGSTDLNALSSAVREDRADLGLAFDGDGDRMLAVDGGGEVVDGDKILATVALWARSKGALPGDAVVTTTMTNLGFRKAMASEGIEVRWTDVGDRYVLEEMRSEGFLLGGEQSGHMINLSYGPTGDGLSAALQLLAALGDTGQSLAQAASRMQRLPQKLVSVRVARKDGLADANGVWELTRRCESELADDGRVVVRASGTEPLVRVMVEAPTADECERWANEIAEAALQELGDATAGE